MFLIYDTETTGLPKDYKAPLTDSENWPRLVQLAWQIHDEKGEVVDIKNFIVRPEGFTIPYGSEKIHGISTERAQKEGQELEFVLSEFNKALESVSTISGHNIEFDNSIMGAEFIRKQMETTLFDKNVVDTKNASTNYCALPGGRGGKYKWPNLGELHQKLFGEGFDAAHNASADVQATARCFLELIRLDIITAPMLKLNQEVVDAFQKLNTETIQAVGITVEPFHEDEQPEAIQEVNEETVSESAELEDVLFTHLHVHTQFSVLDGLSDIPSLLQKAKDDGQQAVAITDRSRTY